jgi:hypothetical protein
MNYKDIGGIMELVRQAKLDNDVYNRVTPLIEKAAKRAYLVYGCFPDEPFHFINWHFDDIENRITSRFYVHNSVETMPVDAEELFSADYERIAKVKGFKSDNGLNEKEKRLLSYLLEDVLQDLTNRGCNDVPDKAWQGWTKEERIQLCKEHYEYVGSPQDFDENFLHLPDYAIIRLLKRKLLKD